MGKARSNKSSASTENSLSSEKPAYFGNPRFERVGKNTNRFHFYIPITLGAPHKVKGDFSLFKNFELEYEIREVLFRLGWTGLKCLDKKTSIGDAYTIKNTQHRIPYPSVTVRSPFVEAGLPSNHSVNETSIQTFKGKLVNDRRNEAEWSFAGEHEHASLTGALVAQGVKKIATFEIQGNEKGKNPTIGCNLLLEKAEDKLVIKNYRANTRSEVRRSLKLKLPFFSLSSARFSLARLIDFLLKGKTLKSIVFDDLGRNGVLSNPSCSQYLRIARLEPDPYEVELESSSASEKITIEFYTILAEAEKEAEAKIKEHLQDSLEEEGKRGQYSDDGGQGPNGSGGSSKPDHSSPKNLPPTQVAFNDSTKLSPGTLESLRDNGTGDQTHPFSQSDGANTVGGNAQAAPGATHTATNGNPSRLSSGSGFNQNGQTGLTNSQDSSPQR